MKKIFFGLMAFMLVALGANGSVGARGLFSFWHQHSATADIGFARPCGHVTATILRGPFQVPVGYRDFGCHTITNMGVMSLANDWEWASPSGAAINTLVNAKYIITGTSSTAATVEDYKLNTWDTIAAVTGTISNAPTNSNPGQLKVQGTSNYTTTESVYEFGLTTAPTPSSTPGTPWTASTSVTGTVTGTPYTASSTTVQGEQQFVFADTTASPVKLCLAISNTNAVVTCFNASSVAGGWVNATTGAFSNSGPSNGDSLVIYPVLVDHLVFATPIGVINGDSIAWTFTLNFPAGS